MRCLQGSLGLGELQHGRLRLPVFAALHLLVADTPWMLAPYARGSDTTVRRPDLSNDQQTLYRTGLRDVQWDREVTGG